MKKVNKKSNENCNLYSHKNRCMLHGRVFVILMLNEVGMFFCNNTCKRAMSLRKHPHMFYTPSFTFLYSRKGEMRGTQNEDLFSGLD